MVSRALLASVGGHDPQEIQVTRVGGPWFQT